MNENLLRRIKSRLNAKCYVMNDAWLRDCVEFFISGKAAHEMTDRHIFEFVEGQWQLSDLREISNEKGCLPRNLAQQVHIVLTGTYILQVDKMYDIASSKYKQLCEIRKVNSENIEVTEKEKSIEYEPKARRMMQLCLTDGVQDVTAIEYKPLEQMTGTLLPGYKIMIIGPITCRRGVILLEDGKYKEVGGEVESLLKLNALENVLARALGETENPDPYNDNGPPRAPNCNTQNVTQDSAGENSFFDDDFENTVDLEAVTVIERLSQENKIGSTGARDQRQPPAEEAREPIEEFLEDIDFEPLENWPSDSSTKSVPARRETEKNDMNNDVIMVERESTFARNQRTSLPNPVANNATSEFPDDDFNFNDCEIIVVSEEPRRQQQSGNSSKDKTETCFKPPMSLLEPRPMNHGTPMPAKKQIPVNVPTTRNKNLMKTSEIVRQTPSKISTPQLQEKICDNLSDVLQESITGKIYRTVRGQVKRHSTLSKKGTCWTLTALIADSTSSVEVCFDSEILEQFLGFTVREFSQKKKLSKSDSRVNNELRQRLREAQHQIENIDALLRLELVQDQMPKVVDITQLTQQQKSLMKMPISD